MAHTEISEALSTPPTPPFTTFTPIRTTVADYIDASQRSSDITTAHVTSIVSSMTNTGLLISLNAYCT